MDVYEQMYRLSSSIYSIHDKMANLENNGKAQSSEFNKLIEYLFICLELEDKLYDLNLSEMLEIMSNLIDNNNVYYDKVDTMDKKQVINTRILNNLFSHAENITREDSNNKTENIRSMSTKIEITDYVHKEFMLYFLLIFNEFLLKSNSDSLKSELINVKYKLAFMDKNIERLMQSTNYCMDIPYFKGNFFLSNKVKKNLELYSYNRETYGQFVAKQELKNILDNNDSNKVSLILKQCAIRAAMLLIDNDDKLADFNDFFHEYINSNDNVYNENVVSGCFKKIKFDRNNQIKYWN